jgi:hypothetical protein
MHSAKQRRLHLLVGIRAGRRRAGHRHAAHLPRFLPGDILLFADKGDLSGKLTRWVTQTFGERPTYAVHTAQVLDSRSVLDMNFVARVRAMADVVKEGRGFEVWRCRRLTTEQREALTRQARRYVNTRFGWAKLFTHALDGLINKVLRREVFFFRRLNHSDRYPLCSSITAVSYDRALKYHFGVPPECADPDAIHDWLKTHPDEWLRVYRLAQHPKHRRHVPVTSTYALRLGSTSTSSRTDPSALRRTASAGSMSLPTLIVQAEGKPASVSTARDSSPVSEPDRLGT